MSYLCFEMTSAESVKALTDLADDDVGAVELRQRIVPPAWDRGNGAPGPHGVRAHRDRQRRCGRTPLVKDRVDDAAQIVSSDPERGIAPGDDRHVRRM